MKYTSFALAAIAPLLSVAAPIAESCEAVSTVYVTAASASATSSASTAASSAPALKVAAASNSTSSSSSSSSGNSSSSAVSSGEAFGYAAQNGGTTGGAGGQETTVTSLEELTEAVKGDEAKIVYIDGTIEGAAKVKLGSNTSLLGKNSESGLTGIGLSIRKVENVIVQNLAISKVTADDGEDAINIDAATNVWIDHMDLSSDMDNGKDYYDGLCDVKHGADYVTISNTHFHDHYKASLVGHSDSNADEDTGYLHVTYANNMWTNINSRMPSVRFGTVHIYNNYYEGGDSGVNTRMGAQVLVESTTLEGLKNGVASLYSDEPGYAVLNDVVGAGDQLPEEGELTSVPYEYELLGSDSVKAALEGSVGNTLSL